MEQRRLRLGDILDDYCPRERRVTNHAVVAMVEEDVKQTRCTTCDAEHAYKGGRPPKRRKAETPAALFKEVLAGMPDADVPVLAAAVPALAVAPSVLQAVVLPTVHVIPPVDALASPRIVSAHPSTQEVPRPMHSDDNDRPAPIPAHGPTDHIDVSGRSEDEPPAVDGPVHRPLIRATLPRPEGQKDVRQVTDFTVRHAPPRGSSPGGFRGGDRDRMRMRAGGGTGTGHGNGNGNGHGNGNGNRSQSSAPRFQGNRPSGPGRPPTGRSGAPSSFRNGGTSGKRGRGSRG